MGYGDNYIFINVIDSLIRAQIHLLESEVSVGSDAEFTCTSSYTLNTNQSRNLNLAYLIKDRKAVEVSIWDTQDMKTTFTRRKVQMGDAGTYSCVLLLNILPHPEMRLNGSNEVNLQITVASNSIMLVCFGILLILCLFLGIWAMVKKQGSDEHILSSSNNDIEYFIVLFTPNTHSIFSFLFTVIECPGFHNERSLTENEVELRETEVVYEDVADATGEKQSVGCSVSEWDEFPEIDLNTNQPYSVSQLYTSILYN
ncbi:uncharacterized protein LOC127622860 isoform X2 [Xyrauchen texanus]|uniref:uncharacterized protein LOC127622860 isoform X2 n=1 Tax=Xyrauchen texanus TaxID=154827 RepID=UPI0022428471|nr:uncharacterized protein LOC127622860 isoform X2 [Xyrauchen texanus]